MDQNNRKYKGLSNIGATCYMNSLLQTLYMTPEFRYNIYKWNYDPKIHPKETDSILYQLQKLFAKLQTFSPDMSPLAYVQVSTKDLVKSFQWQDEQAHMQQDIQQFNRLLFQALQKSFSQSIKSTNTQTQSSQKQQKIFSQSSNHLKQANLVKEYYQGELIHYTKCHQCQNQSIRQEYFQDINLTVKNIYEKVYNKSLELAFQRYLKPQYLDQQNLYDCSICHKKTHAQRGARFIKMPKLFNVILQRFMFDYFTMERQKLNDRVQFPWILNFNNYMHGYDQIPDKLSQDSSAYFVNENTVKKTIIKKNPTNNISNPTLLKTVQKKGQPSIAGKTKTKPSANTKSFLAQMRKKKNMYEQNEDLVYVSGNSSISNISNDNAIKTHSMQEVLSNGMQKSNSDKEQNKPRSLQIDIISEQHQPQEKTSIKQIKIAQQKTINGSTILSPPPIPPMLNLIPNQLSIPYKYTESHQKVSITIQEELKAKNLQKQTFQKEKQQKFIELQKKNRQLKQKYLKDGPLVYQLYSVLVHNGTANHGHYYSYIKSFQNQKWFCFNDERVSQINVCQVQKTFGSGHSNAYALYYRMVEHCDLSQQKNFQLLKQPIPEYISQKLKKELEEINKKQQTKLQNLQNVLCLKICYQLYVKQLQIYKSNSLELCLQKARQMFSIPVDIKSQNIRLRMFNPVSQSKLDTYTGKQHLSLQQLKICSYKTLLLQIKKDDQQFEEFQIGCVNLRVAFLEQNIKLQSLDQMFLKTHKVSVKKNATLKDIQVVFLQKRKEVLKKERDFIQKISVIKRHINDEYSYHEILTIQSLQEKTMQDLMINQNEILFVETQKKVEQLVWPKQFQNQLYRITIRYNSVLSTTTPNYNDFTNYLTDSRISIKSLKDQLCAFLQKNPDEIIMKMGSKSGRELKDLSITLKDARFITGTQIYLQQGIPAKQGQIRIQLYLCQDADPNAFNRLHQFQYLSDVPISGAMKASEVKEIFSKIYKKIKNFELDPKLFRIREKVSDKVGKIYRQKAMKEQQLIQKRQIAIEILQTQDKLINDFNMKQFSIYIRSWDQLNWKLSNKEQYKVCKSTTMKQLLEMIKNRQQKQVKQENIQNNSINCTSQVQNLEGQRQKQIQLQSQFEICRILSIHKFSILDLVEMEWFKFENYDQSPVIAEPMFVNSDGLLYIIKKSSQQPRQLTKEEQKRFGGILKSLMIKRNNPVRKQKVEKTMKIKVVQKQHQVLQKEQICIQQKHKSIQQIGQIQTQQLQLQKQSQTKQ